MLISFFFFAKHEINPDITFAVTAGHCYADRGSNLFYYYPWDGKPDGTWIGIMEIHRVEDYDYSLIELRRGVSKHGAHLCKSGLRTHATCGYIKAFDGIFIYSEGFDTELIITDTVADGGDSGGTIIKKICIQ
ncbi:S1 family peptidase [Gigaspora margarita]|uniref:S1 family peptidase n=1 Tax=Gigaspora margarita TaxID=4874 RepID=A0A8H3XFU0_GIGMA|nr:S1 family peptidase [Gigaspora margarita]